MATDEEKATWEAKLVGKKYVIKGIKTQHDAMMKAVYDTLGISEDDFPTQTRVNAFIEERQGQPRPVQGEASTDDDEDNILGNGVYERLTNAVCFFKDEEKKPIGAGFAVSNSVIFSVFRNFVDPSIGKEVTCYFGKPNKHVIRRLVISKFDRKLDYCVLKTVPGEALLPAFLEVSTSPLKPGKQSILAAFQIGIQDDLKDLDPDLSVGVFKGEISKLYPRHFVYQCPSFAGDSGGAVVLKDGRVVGIHQETVIQARERIQHASIADLDTDSRLESVEASIDELLRSLASGSIGLQLNAIPESKQLDAKSRSTIH